MITKTLLLVALISSAALYAQKSDIGSKVYSFDKLDFKQTKYGAVAQVMDGQCRDLSHLHISVTRLNPGKTLRSSKGHEEEEELIIIKSGKLQVKLGDLSKTIGPGSVVVFMPEEDHSIKNAGDEDVIFYTLDYKSKLAVDKGRGKEAGGSLVVDWDDVKYNEHERGGIRQFFNKPTAMLRRFEMHVTNLNAGIKSHEPHTHRAAEIVLMIDGKTEMEIAGEVYKGNPGDIYFLGSEVSHAIKNIDTKQCQYFAFQWE